MKLRKWIVQLRFNGALWGLPFAFRFDWGLGNPIAKWLYLDAHFLCFQLSVDYDAEGTYA